MEYVYILKSLKDGKQYVGLTGDFHKRLFLHNTGRITSTKSRRPFVLIHIEEFLDRPQAAKREKFLKSGEGRKELACLLAVRRPL